VLSGHTKFGLETRDVPDLNKQMTEETRILELIKMLDWHTPACIVKSVSEELVNIPDRHLPMLIQPLGKAYWDNAALVLTKIESRRLKRHIPDLLEWLQDLNWPGAQTIAKLLTELGEPVIAHVKPIFQSNDSTWIYWVLSEIVSQWPAELVKQLKDNLAALSERGLGEGTEDIVEDILQGHDLKQY
jgi:hypothetical protein